MIVGLDWHGYSVTALNKKPLNTLVKYSQKEKEWGIINWKTTKDGKKRYMRQYGNDVLLNKTIQGKGWVLIAPV